MLQNLILVIALGSLAFVIPAGIAVRCFRNRPTIQDVVYRTLFLVLALLPILALMMPRPLTISVQEPEEIVQAVEPVPTPKPMPSIPIPMASNKATPTVPSPEVTPIVSVSLPPEPRDAQPEFTPAKTQPEIQPRDTVSVAVVIPEPQPETAKPEKYVAKMPHWSVLMCGVWLLGMIPGLLLLLHNVAVYRKILRETEPLENERWMAVISELESRLGLRRHISYRISGAIDVPQVVGVFRPTVLLSQPLVFGPPNRAILIHELSHVQRNDVFWQIFSSVVCLVYWFEPLIWLCAAGLRGVREEICDNQVLRFGESGPDYATTLLDMSSVLQRGYGLDRKIPQRIGCAVTTPRTKNHVEHRILWLLDPNRKREPMSLTTKTFTVTLMLALALAAVMLCPALDTKSSTRERQDNEQKTEKITDENIDDDTTTIRGKVVDEEKQPVAGIKVFVLGKSSEADFYETHTDKNGRFSIPKPENRSWDGVYAVDTERKLGGQTHWSVNSKTGKIRDVTITLEKYTRVITGTVVDAKDQPVEGISVYGAYSTADSIPVLTDKNGQFEFLYPEKKPLLTVVAYKRGVGLGIYPTGEYDSYRPHRNDIAAPQRPISDGPFPLKLTPIEPTRIRLVSEEGQPLPGAKVYPWIIQKPQRIRDDRNQFNTAGTAGFDAIADENGVAVLESIPKTFLSNSTFSADGSSDGMKMPDGTTWHHGDTRETWEKMERREEMPTMVLPRQSYARITVRMEDGIPAPDVGVSVRWHNGGGGLFQTDKNGECTLQDNVGLIHNISFESDKGAAPALFNFDYGDGSEEKQVDVVLKPGIKFHGKVFLPDGSPAEDFYVTMNEKDPNPPASYRPSTSDWVEWQTGKFYTTTFADRSIYPGQGTKKLPPGEFEALLPAVPRTFHFDARSGPGPDNPKEFYAWIDNVQILGTEKELKIDFHLQEVQRGVSVPMMQLDSKNDQPLPEKQEKEQKTNENVADTVIRGQVVDEEKQPVAGIKVFVLNQTGDNQKYETLTDNNGRFSFSKPEDRFHDTVYAVDYERKLGGQTHWGVNSKTGKIPEVTVPVYRYPRVITGTVVDANDRPAERIFVYGVYQVAQSVPVQTDKDGKFTFLYLEKVPLTKIVAFKNGVGLDIHPTEEIDPLQPMGDEAVTPPEKITDGPFHLKLTPLDSVKFLVLNEQKEPIPGAIVGPWLIQKPGKLVDQGSRDWGSPYVIEQGRNNFNTAGSTGFDAITDENGIAVLNSVPKTFLAESTFSAYGPLGGVAGDLEAPDGKKLYYSKTTKNWKEMDIRDEMRILVLPRQGSARITVRTEDGTPVPEVGISVRWHNGSHGWRQTDENGESLLHDNVNVIYNLSFESDKGAAPALFNFSVGDGSEEKHAEVVLKPGIKFHGKVLMPDGSPAEDFCVTIYEKDPNPPASFQHHTVYTEDGQRGTIYTTNTADRSVYPRNWTQKELPPGDFEALLPAVSREYSFSASKHAGPDNPKQLSTETQKVRLLGTEKELKLDFHLRDANAVQLSLPTPPLPAVDANPEETPPQPILGSENEGEAKLPEGATIKVFDANNQPLSGVELEVRFRGEKGGTLQIKRKTDENGAIPLER